VDRRNGSFIALKPLGAICRCGTEWRNPDLETPTPIDRPLQVV
jgi:hypothetical protein